MPRLAISDALLDKYDTSAPRYTSYPPIPYWPAVTEEERQNWNDDEMPAVGGSLSLYIHVPFCASRCYYCGCFVVITSKKEQGRRYAEAVKKEMALVQDRIAPRGRVRQFHFGGGTPTFLPVETLSQMVDTARELYPFDDEPEMSIEIDPRTVPADSLERLRGIGFNRISMGIQDFDERVQRLVNRIQPYSLVAGLMEAGRGLGFSSINFDLIYGLPGQTPGSFAETINRVGDLRPDRTALYHYAHLPQSIPYQRRFAPESLPTKETKLEIFLSARERLTDWGYVPIGLDHFALGDDDLATAYRDGSLQRNFMGYTTQAGDETLAFGISSISDYRGRFWQNEKKLNRYYQAVEGGRIPIARAMRLDGEDRLRKNVIQHLFCAGRVDFDDLAHRFEIDPQRHFADELRLLEPMARDGLVVLDTRGISVTDVGQMFLRNIAVVFDAYHATDSGVAAKFSRTV